MSLETAVHAVGAGLPAITAAISRASPHLQRAQEFNRIWRFAGAAVGLRDEAANPSYRSEFPGRSGFSAQNLWLMRQFFNEYRDEAFLQPLVRKITWAKNLVILARGKDDLA